MRPTPESLRRKRALIYLVAILAVFALLCWTGVDRPFPSTKQFPPTQGETR